MLEGSHSGLETARAAQGAHPTLTNFIKTSDAPVAMEARVAVRMSFVNQVSIYVKDRHLPLPNEAHMDSEKGRGYRV